MKTNIEMALEALKVSRDMVVDDKYAPLGWSVSRFDEVLTAGKEALAQPEQEPVTFEKTVCPFCTSEWVTAEQHDRNVDKVERKPLTEDEVVKMDEWLFDQPFWRVLMLVRAIEAAHGITGEKNGTR